MSHKLPRQSILRGRREFETLFAKGKRTGTRHIQAITLTSNQSSDVKSGQRLFAVCIARKYGAAVMRNRAKRQIRELYRLRQERFGTGIWVAFLPRFSWRKLEADDQRREFEKLMAKMKLESNGSGEQA